jgi:two-component system, OmpR family, phosphate regulon sensor histidine kinase PhoR
VRKPRSFNSLVLILLLAVVLPVLFYSGYELSAVSSDEALMTSVYQRQLDVILFSLNQYSWDVVNSWTGSVARILEQQDHVGADSLKHAVSGFLSGKPALDIIIVADTGFTDVGIYRSQPVPGRESMPEQALLPAVSGDREKIRQLVSYLGADYRKIDPFRITLPGEQNQRLALRFIAGGIQNPRVVILLLNERLVVRELLSPKLQEAAGGEFVLAVLQSGVPVYTTGPVNPEDLKVRKDLWLLPSFSLGIRPAGTTVDELVRARFIRNILLIVLLDIILIGGAFLVVRNLRREVELIRMKEGFVSNVSHELRTPLSLIRMYAETLEMGRLTSEEKRHEYSATILHESERLTRLVNTVLNFSGPDAGAKSYHFRTADVGDIIRNVVETFRLRFEAEGISPVLDIESHLPVVKADPEAAAEVLINLIDNAVKYGGPEKYLRISAAADGPGVVVAVEDHGHGIAPQHHRKIFDEFYRITGGTTDTVRGTGLGLALVRRIMEAHGGSVRVESSPGKGSTFVIRFPATRE